MFLRQAQLDLGTVPIDGIKEFTLITNNFNAEYGRNGSAQVQILTKSGSNQFHGRAFEFFENDKLNARDYFDRTGKAAVLRDNKYGAVAGGPIKADKAFWFGTYEAQKTRGVGGTRVATVPRPDQVSGPIDPTAAALLTQLQVPTSPSGTVSNGAPLLTNSYAFSTRVDANLTPNDFLYVRFGMFDSEERVRRPHLHLFEFTHQRGLQRQPSVQYHDLGNSHLWAQDG